MISLADIRDYIETFGIGEHFSVGRIDKRKDRSIGLYQRTNYDGAEIALGGVDTTLTGHKRVNILVHWNNNYTETEEAAQAIYDELLYTDRVQIGERQIDYISLEVPEPVDVGSDDRGVFERVIWVDFWYEKIQNVGDVVTSQTENETTSNVEFIRYRSGT